MGNWHRLEGHGRPGVNLVDLNARRFFNEQQAAMERMGLDVEDWVAAPLTEAEQTAQTFQERLASWGTSPEAIQGQDDLMRLVAMQ